MRYEVEIANSEPTFTAVIRGHVQREELSRFVPAACGEVWAYFRSAGLPKPGRNLALYLENSAVEAGVEVIEPVPSTARIVSSQLPVGRVARAVHFGPYPRLSEAHAAIRSWCAAGDHRPTGVCWELYDHWQESWNSDSSKIRTDVFYLLEEKPANQSLQPTALLGRG
jgi:effector-binding domain-containing protein